MQILDNAHNNQAALPTWPFLYVGLFVFHHTKCTHGCHHHRHCYKTLEHLLCLLLPRCTLNINSFQQSGFQQALQMILLHTEENVSVC